MEAEGFEYIRLGTLLRKPRSPRKRASVERILQSAAPLMEKIHEIERIDAIPDDEGPRAKPPDQAKAAQKEGKELSPAPADAPRPDGGKAEAERGGEKPRRTEDEAGRRERQAQDRRPLVEAVRRRQKLARVPMRASFLDYLFAWRKKYRELAARNRFVATGFLSLFPSIDGKALADYGKALKAEAANARSAVDPTLREGWRALDRHDYNLVALFKRLLDEVAKGPFERAGGKEGLDATERASFPLLTDFLSLRSIPAAAASLKDALDRGSRQAPAEGGDASAKEILDKACQAVGALVGPTAKSPSLEDALLACASARARRPVSVNDLVSPDAGDPLCTTCWDCPPEIQAAIDAAVDEILARLPPIVARSREIAMEYGLSDSGEMPDFPAYRSRLGLKELPDAAKADAVALAAESSRAFVERFSRFLTDEMPTISFAKFRPFPKGAFEYELERLGLASDHLLKARAPLSYGRYRAIVAGANPTGLEAEGVESIQAAAEWFRKIAQKTRAALRANLVPEAEPLFAEGPMAGLRPAQWAREVAEVATLASGYLLDAECLGAVREYRALRDEIGAAKRNLARLAGPDEYSALSARFGL